MKTDILIVGAGAAGFFAAIRCAQKNPNLKVTLVEATARPLTKVKISGGGRCNVTHNCKDHGELTKNYPRGNRELRQVFSRFSVDDVVTWFKSRGVELKAEADGRMFPQSNKSETIIACLREQAETSGVVLELSTIVTSVTKSPDSHFLASTKRHGIIESKKLLLSTGSAPLGHKIAKQFNHNIKDPVPSLFTFEVQDKRLEDIAGVSVRNTCCTLLFPQFKKKFKQEGPLLVTHWGLSAPSVLKLSAWAARELFDHNYQAELKVDWLPNLTRTQVEKALRDKKVTDPTTVASKLAIFEEIPKRLWAKLLAHLKIDGSIQIGNLKNSSIDQLVYELKSSSFSISGKGVFKEEFVTCGGVKLKEINFQTMESKMTSGLYFAGEVLDIDGVTGGFNFQNAWSTAWIAATAMSDGYS